MGRDAKYDCLFEPLKVGPKTMRNRFYQVPHCNGAGTKYPGTQAAFRETKAEGGWAVVNTEACHIHPSSDYDPYTLSHIWDDQDVINLRHMCDSVHKWDSLAGVELVHTGSMSPNLFTRHPGVSVSGGAGDTTPAQSSHAMDEEDIKWAQNLYVEAAKRSVQAGFDIAYVYGSHAVMPMQFLSKFYNKREDKYGGSLENRARFWIETLALLKQHVGDDCAIACRISVDQMMGSEGIEASEDPVGFAELAEKEGVVDIWDVNVCDFMEWGEDAGPSRFYKANHQAPFTKFIRAATKQPMVTVGRLTSPDDMAEVITSGQADIIGGARPSIADPFLPKKIEEGRNEDIRECIGCNICIQRWERAAPLVCTQNAVANEEYRRGWHPEKVTKAKNPGSVLVVGAGPAGLECARILGERGYDVHLRDTSSEPGGHVKDVQRMPGLAEWGRVITYRTIQLDKLKSVELQLGVDEMTADDVLAYGADKVVLATGSTWGGDGYSHVSKTSLPNVDASNAQFLTPEQVMAGKAVGDKVVVLDADGYFMGATLAQMLAEQGKEVEVVTHLGSVGPIMDFTLESPNMHRRHKELGIKHHTGSWVQDVELGNRVKLKIFDLLRDGSKRTTDPVAGELPRIAGTEYHEIETDSVVLVTGRIPVNKLWGDLRARRDEWAKAEIAGIYQAGDCYSPRPIAEAIFDGHRIAREFETDDPQQALPFLREMMVWGRDNDAREKEIHGE